MDFKDLYHQAVNFSETVKEAGEKEKKLDSKAKVRNRGTVVFPAESPNVKDKKDHFPINNINQARNALARCMQYKKVPSWYKGSLKSLHEAVQKKVHAKYPSIGKSEVKKKSERYYELLEKYGQSGDPLSDLPEDTRTPEQVGAEVRKNFPWLYPPGKPQEAEPVKALPKPGALPQELLNVLMQKVPGLSGMVSLHPRGNTITAHFNLNALGPGKANEIKAELDRALVGTGYSLDPTVIGVKPDIDELDATGFVQSW